MAVDDAKVTVTDWMISVPWSVWRVKVLDVVAVPPGVSVVDAVSTPVPRVTNLPGVVDAGVHTAPSE